ncbi:MAG TPA: rRNA maturation RNase YbeY [Clostridiales bacterium]|nr:rRNA maturation RNase YbeY [Clostridiales bacterium]
MAHKVKVIITDSQNAVKVPKGLRLLIRRCCTAVLVCENFESDAEVSVTIVDDEQIQKLNAKYRNIDKPTDVLSFPLGVEGEYDVNLDTGEAQLGDIVLSLERAMEQAERYGHSLDREVGYLTVHSMLHLLGYDHESGGLELVRMREHEERVLSELGLRRDGKYYIEENEI